MHLAPVGRLSQFFVCLAVCVMLVVGTAATHSALADEPGPMLRPLPPVDSETLPPPGPAGAAPGQAPQMNWEPVPPGLATPAPGAVVVEEWTPSMPEPAMPGELPPPPKIWEGSVEFGSSGSEGNTQVFDLRVGGKAKRTTKANELSLSIDYKKSSNNSLETANRMFFEGRDEWMFDASPWSVFIHETTEYDEFKNFDIRVAADTGFAYQFWKTDVSFFKGRFGAGFSHETGSPDDAYVPEGLAGAEFKREFTRHRKLTMAVDYYPNIEDVNEFRVTSQLGWQMALDENGRLNIKFSVLDRYDSTPNGVRPNDIDYSAVLLWNF